MTTTKCCIYQLVWAWPSRGDAINERFEWRTLRISISIHPLDLAGGITTCEAGGDWQCEQMSAYVNQFI